jgi:methyltransferase (TIGR00027 family)
MEAGKHSYMAEATALLRAAHQVLDADPKILEDPLALSLLGSDTEERIQADLERMQREHLRGARAFAVMRSRFTEDALAEAVARGVGQYVVLGAGLDTFAYRNPFPEDELTVFEIDHPDTQRWKLGRLDAAGVTPPANVHYLPVDFEKQSLAEGLESGGFDSASPAFFSWLGVTYYLHMDAVLQTFKIVGSMAASSQLVFDFVVDDSVLSESEQAGVARVSSVVKGYGEPWLSRFAPTTLQETLRDLGFSSTRYVSASETHEMYFASRSDGLFAHAALQLMSATV